MACSGLSATWSWLVAVLHEEVELTSGRCQARPARPERDDVHSRVPALLGFDFSCNVSLSSVIRCDVTGDVPGGVTHV